MAIKIKIFGLLRLNSGLKELELEAGKGTRRLGDILYELGSYKGLEPLKELASSNMKNGSPFIIMVDGTNWMQLKGLDSVVKDGQVVSIFPPSAGG